MRLVRVNVRFRLEGVKVPWFESELVRRGARDAHLTPDGHVAILVAAASSGAAGDYVSELLGKVGAKDVEISRDGCPTS